jgi:carbonic anhydrase
MTMKKLAVAALAFALPLAALATPEQDAILDDLREGNALYARDSRSGFPGIDSARRASLVAAQNPKAIVLGCSDSRVPPEHIFRQGLGDLFVARIAGNVPMSGIVASVEYAVEHLHTPVLLVLGHASCGAVKATIDQLAAPGGLTPDLQALVDEIIPSVLEAQRRHPEDLLGATIEVNAHQAAEHLVERSNVVREAFERGELEIVVGLYALDTGKVKLERLPRR